MNEESGRTPGQIRTLPSLRWWIGGLLFLSTIINYIDRQTLSVLGPNLKSDYHWTNVDFAWIVIFFRIAYSIGQTVSGRILDRFGTRKGLTVTVLFYSVVAVCTSFANGLRSFCAFRFLLGAGESANWPGAAKAVSEWFPKRERGWAVALFDSGSSVGAAVAPFLVLWLYHNFGGWRMAFVFTGTLGFLWVVLWRLLYHPPESHPRLRESEKKMILDDKAEQHRASAQSPTLRWKQLLRLPQTWGIIAGRALTDPVWFFISDWFAIYLVAKGVRLEQAVLVFWIPFVASDLGNFFGGGVSSWLIRRGWSVGKARKAVVVFGGFGVCFLAGTVFTSNPLVLAMLFGFSTFAYAAFSTIVLVLPSDLFPSRSVATVSGMAGTGAGLGTILSTYLIGYVSDHYSFAPILIIASFVPLVGMVLVLLLVRNSKSGDSVSLQQI